MNEWEALRQECLSCHACTLADTRQNVVFGVGRPDAEVMFIGEAPGANEDMQGEPFVGRGGKLLDDMLHMIGLDRSRIYITNSIKCRPPENRDPMNTEKDACSGFLRRQRALMKPKIIVCLGRISAMELIRPDFKISLEHGQFYERENCLMMAMYHRRAAAGSPEKAGDIRGSEALAGEDTGDMRPHAAGFLTEQGTTVGSSPVFTRCSEKISGSQTKSLVFPVKTR